MLPYLLSKICYVRYWLLLASISCYLISCDTSDEPDIPTNSLAAYFQKSELTPINQLIACAAGGQKDFLVDTEFPISIFFLPEGDAHHFRYFETETNEVDPNDHRSYQEVPLSDIDVFNGFLRRFVRSGTNDNRWCIVTFENGDSLHYSNPIHLKFSELPTEYNPDLLEIDQSNPLNPKFSWADGSIDENVIYFHVVSDEENNLISGTYTVDKSFQFYELSNVVLNINPVNPPPTLEIDESYTFTMMGVSIDNWVNLIITAEFDTFQ